MIIYFIAGISVGFGAFGFIAWLIARNHNRSGGISYREHAALAILCARIRVGAVDDFGSASELAFSDAGFFCAIGDKRNPSDWVEREDQP